MKISRRGFITSMGAACAASAPFAGFPAVVKRRRANEMLSHAAIGCGNQAAYDLSQLASHRDINITALCDVDSRYLEQAHRLFPNARIYRDAFEMFEKEGAGIDSVNVSTPDHTHAQYILEALKRGLNVYAQKPLCHSLEECRAVAELAAERNAVTQMGTQIAAWQCDRRTVEALKSGVIGEVRHVWLFSTRRDEPPPDKFLWPLPELPVPETLDWKLWLGRAKWRPYGNGYHPGAWRKWREFGTSWLGDLGLHLMSPVWLGMELGKTKAHSAVAEVAADNWTPAQREQFWPSMSHVTWTMPGVKASGMKPFTVEWCDGFGNVAYRLEPRFLPPAFLQDVAAQTPMKRLPPQGRVVEGTEGWLLSTHFGDDPFFVMKDGSTPPKTPRMGPEPSHYHQYVDCCLGGAGTQSNFSMAGSMTEWGFLGNLAQLQAGEPVSPQCGTRKSAKAGLAALLVCCAAFACSLSASAEPSGARPDESHAWAVHDVNRPNPVKVESVPGRPPSDAIVLFDGTAESVERNWRGKDGKATKWVVRNGEFVCTPGSGGACTAERFGDCQLHVEWKTPKDDLYGWGNSGVFLMGCYEIQILDSSDVKPSRSPWKPANYADGQAGAVYGENPPLVQPCRKPDEWQAYDIVFHPPLWEGKRLVDPGSVTVFFNGVLVQDHFPLQGTTGWRGRYPHPKKADGPIVLQDHGHPVPFRNIWIRRIPSRHADTVNGGPGLKYGDVAALRHRLAGESLAFAREAKDPAERFIRLWESYCYEPDREVMSLIGKCEAECVEALGEKRGDFGDSARFRAFGRFVEMLVAEGWIKEDAAIKKAFDAQTAPPPPKASNLRDI